MFRYTANGVKPRVSHAILVDHSGAFHKVTHVTDLEGHALYYIEV